MNQIKRMLVVATLLVAPLLQMSFAQQQQQDEVRVAAERIASSVLVSGQAMNFVMGCRKVSRRWNQGRTAGSFHDSERVGSRLGARAYGLADGSPPSH
jgi:hypothetical protein